jgi:hypothetical protein
LLTLSSLMLITLGFLVAAIFAVVILPSYRRRIERFASEGVRRSLPLTESEILADRDRLRAEYAINISTLENKLEQAELSHARLSIEINRRDARVHELTESMGKQKLTVEELENAKRVLEQAILDRLPKVEQRLAESRKLLSSRDADITVLSQSSARQTQALEETTQINKQQSEELHRLRAALETRAVRHRETLGDPRFDGEVALRTEIEMLRSKTRDQSKLIERLQTAKSSSEEQLVLSGELERLKRDLEKAEADVVAAKGTEGFAVSERATLETQVKDLERDKADRVTEIAGLKAALDAFKSDASRAAGGGDLKTAASSIAARAEIGALKAETEEQRRIIQSLRAEVASSNERLARQGQHFREELRRLGSGVLISAEQRARDDERSRAPSLAERIAARPARPQPVSAPQLKTVNGSDVSVSDGNHLSSEEATPPPLPDSKAAADVPPRRSRLLDRIGSLDK